MNKWFANEHRNETSTFAERLLMDNIDYLDSETKFTTTGNENVLKSRHNIYKRFSVIFDSRTFSMNKKAERSFKIKTLLGVI